MPTIDFVAPPFAGHLFPAIQLAKGLADAGVAKIRILSTPGAAPAIAAAGLQHVEFLPDRDAAVWAIANTPRRVGSNPLALWHQVKSNFALMGELQHQLRQVWCDRRPDLVIADFVVPIAGLTARSLDIPWWTGMATPCVLETSDGTPPYLGGWGHYDHPLAKIRDAVGRRLIRLFKKSSAFFFARPLRDLGINGLYRDDGTEVIYSPECILAYGMRQFEFPRSWPAHVTFTGPLTDSPYPAAPLDSPIPERSVLISLGTHLPWAKERAIELFRKVAILAPELTFYFSRGIPGSDRHESQGNFHLYDYISYCHHLHNFSAVVIHGGTGVTYSAIEAGRPMLVWPQDYDQFDHAARIVQHRLGKRLIAKPAQVVNDLRDLICKGTQNGDVVATFQSAAKSYHPVNLVLERLKRLGVL